MPEVLRIALPVPMRRTFDYLPPEGISVQDVSIGCRAIVLFRNRTVTGVVTGTSANSEVPVDKLRAINELPDNHPLVTSDIMDLCLWLSTYYHHPLGEVLELALPAMLRKGSSLKEAEEPHWRRILAPDTEVALRGDKQKSLWSLFCKQSLWPHKDLLSQDFTRSQMNRLAELGLTEAVSLLPSYSHETDLSPSPPLPLNTEQQAAVDSVSVTSSSPGFQVTLLEGVTGSGKTEVYLQLIQKVLDQGKQALILVPEIGLTPQTVRRFRSRFNVPVATMHSGLNDRERLQSWCQSRLPATDAAQARILIGTRSAVLTPMPDLGLIVIDEEHDGSFKQQDGLRYNARDLAVKRAHKAGIPVMLGSATPSLETLHNTYSRRYQHVKLTQRAGNARPPRLHLHSILHQPLQHGLAIPVVNKIRQHLDDGQQVMLFINRRGYAPTLICRDCGWMAGCRACDARMTLHASPPHLHCHHCDHQTPLPRMCPECNSLQIEAIGQGTERIGDNIRQLFPDTTIHRVDRDTVRTKDAFDNLLDEIHKGEPCILVGTQMLAKGHHFPDVTLVVIVDADSGLFSADFRGMEKTAQLLMQVSGRAGRGDKPGEVWIQTLYADHPQLHLLVEGSYHSLATNILQERKGLQLPPYTFMALLRTECAEREMAEQLQRVAREFIQQWLNSYWQNKGADITPVTLIGPFPAPMERRAGRFRQQMQILSSERSALHRVLNSLALHLEGLQEFRKVRWSLDVDPVDMS